MRGLRALVRTIGLRHLVGRPLRTALTAGGIAAGVALVFSITSMNAAMSETVRSTVTAFAGPADLQVTAITTGTLDDELVEAVRAVDGVTTAAPVLQSRTRLSAGDREANAFVIGGTVDLLAFAPATTPSAGARAGIAVGSELARRLHLDPGDVVEIETPAQPVELKVGSVLPEGPLDRINGGCVAALPLPVARDVFDRADQVDLVLIDVADGADLETVIGDLRAAAGSAGVVSRPDDAPGDRAENVVPFLLLTQSIGTIALFVSMVLVFNTMSMAMAERRSELALAAALGARRRQLFLATLGEAAVLGVLGTVIGLAVGGLLADVLLDVASDGMKFVLPIDPPSGAVLVGPHLAVAALGGIAVAVLGAVLPARRVLRTAPIAALRPTNDYEWVPDEGRRRRPVAVVIAIALLAGGLASGLGLSSTAPSLGRVASIVIAMLASIMLLLPAALPVLSDRLGTLMERRWSVIGRLAGDALRANPRRTSITLSTLILPLATVIGMGTAFSSTQGVFHDLSDNYFGTEVVVNSTSFDGYAARQPLAPETVDLVEDVPGVRAALPSQNVFLTTDDGMVIVYVTPETMAADKGVPEALRNDRNADDPAEFRAGLLRGEVAASRLAARNRGLEVGDTVTFPSVDGPVELRVASLFDDMAGVDTFYLDRATFLRHWTDELTSGIAVHLDPRADPDQVIDDIESTFRDHDLRADVLRREPAVARLEAGLSGLFSVSRVVQVAAVIVAGLSLTSTAFTTVLERRWSLGLQQALGMSRSQIARSLALEAAALAVVGGAVAAALGIAIGVLLAASFGLVAGSAMPVVIPWGVVGACALGALVLTLVATAYPRRLAARTQIIEALVAE